MNTRELIASLFPVEERENLRAVRIKGDASNRQYFRVHGGTSGTAIACIDPAFRGVEPDDYPFLTVGALLAGHGVRVPEVRGFDSREGLLLLEDCGDRMLQDEVETADAASVAERYRQVIDMLISIQSIRPRVGSVPFTLSFDREKLMFEFDFFIRHALQGVFEGMLEDERIAALRHEFESIAGQLVRPDQFVLNHRDYHSRNIMLSGNEPVVIDFQDARLGLPQYDAVSMLRDSYVQLDPSMVDELKNYHFSRLEQEGLVSTGFSEYLRYFDLMAFQRNVKAVGTFCYQVSVVGNDAFQRSIAPTLAYLPDYIEARPELETAGKLLEPIISRFAR